MAKTLADKLRGLKKDLYDCGHLRRAGVVAELVKEAEKLELAVVAFDTILFSGDQDRDPGEAIHRRDALVTVLADAMDRQGWAGTLVENIELVERITNLNGKVLVKPKIIKYTFKTRQTHEAALPEPISAFGATEAEAVANLQSKADAL